MPPEYIGGVERYTYDLAAILTRTNVDVKVIYPQIDNDYKGEFEAVPFKQFGNFWRNRIEFRISYYVRYKRIMRNLRKIIDGIDIIHTHRSEEHTSELQSH